MRAFANPLVLFAVSAVSSGGLVAAAEPKTSPAATLNFTNDILPVLTKFGCNSGSCHGKGSGQNGFKLSLFGFDPEFDYAALVQEAAGRRVDSAAPDFSLMLRKVAGKEAHGGGVRFAPDSEAYALLRRWIAAGTPWGEAGDPVFASIEVEPVETILDGDGRQPLHVVARYSDGTTRDVTPTAEYFSQKPALLSVAADGQVQMLGGQGEGTVMVRYLGAVAIARFTAPYRRGVSEDAYAKFQPKNYVDELVLNKWRKLGLVPSPPATDAEFVRRPYLDIIGTLPTPQEVREFLDDQSVDKRDKLVDRLLERDEYAAFWANKWGDVLRNKQAASNYKDSSVKFAEWIRQAFAKNMPFDQFARELLTVTGKLSEHPQIDWYRQVNNPQNRVEDTAQVFLGLRVSCANCHNHPFERISQNEYWQFAAFFARLDAISYGQVNTVSVKNEGSMNNPRTGKSVNPKPFGGSEVEYVKDEDPRVKLVDWMTAKDNPYFARAVSNRLWAHYMDLGLVEAVDDLRATNPPTNPELLDALAADLVDHQYDLKHLMQVILKSRVYGLSAVPLPENKMDRQNYARHYPRRLSAQVLYDALSTATGVPESFKDFPNAKRAVELPTELVQNDFLDVFGRSKRDTPCECEASDEPNLPQVLFLMYSPELQNKISHKDGTVANLVKSGKSTADMVEELFLIALSRKPTTEESTDAVALIESAAKRQAAIEDLLWTLLNSKEFLFSH